MEQPGAADRGREQLMCNRGFTGVFRLGLMQFLLDDDDEY